MDKRIKSVEPTNQESGAEQFVWEKSEVKIRWFNLRPGESFVAYANGREPMRFGCDADGTLVCEFKGATYYYAGFVQNCLKENNIQFISMSQSQQKPGSAEPNSNSELYLLYIYMIYTQHLLAKLDAEKQNRERGVEQHRKTIEEKRAEITNLLSKLDKLEKEKASLEKQLRKLQAHIAKLEQALQAAEKAGAKLEEQNHRLKTENRNYRMQLQRQAPTLNRLHDELQESKRIIKELQYKLAAAHNTILALKRKLQQKEHAAKEVQESQMKTSQPANGQTQSAKQPKSNNTNTADEDSRHQKDTARNTKQHAVENATEVESGLSAKNIAQRMAQTIKDDMTNKGSRQINWTNKSVLSRLEQLVQQGLSAQEIASLLQKALYAKGIQIQVTRNMIIGARNRNNKKLKKRGIPKNREGVRTSTSQRRRHRPLKNTSNKPRKPRMPAKCVVSDEQIVEYHSNIKIEPEKVMELIKHINEKHKSIIEQDITHIHDALKISIAKTMLRNSKPITLENMQDVSMAKTLVFKIEYYAKSRRDINEEKVKEAFINSKILLLAFADKLPAKIQDGLKKDLKAQNEQTLKQLKIIRNKILELCKAADVKQIELSSINTAPASTLQKQSWSVRFEI